MSGPQNPGDNKFTAKARMLQSIHRASIGETEMGVGPTAYTINSKLFLTPLFSHEKYT